MDVFPIDQFDRVILAQKSCVDEGRGTPGGSSDESGGQRSSASVCIPAMGGCGCSGSFGYAIAGAVVIESVRAASVSVVFSIAVPSSVLEVQSSMRTRT